jgi:hypothetical protein
MNDLAMIVGRCLVVLVGLFLTGMIGTTCYYYRSSQRMKHILPLGIAFLLLVLISLEGFWSGYRSPFYWDGLVLIASYILGGHGLYCLLHTSSYPPRAGGHHE